MDAVCGADSGAHHTCNTFDPTGGISIETVDAPEVRKLDPTLLRWIVFSTLFGILKGSARATLTKRGKEVPHSGAKALDD